MSNNPDQGLYSLRSWEYTGRMLNATAAPRFVSLRVAARRLGVRDQMAALELLAPAEADVRRNYLGELTVAEADLDALLGVLA